MTGLGHLERLPPERLSGRYGIGQETSAGAYSGDGLAPIPDARQGGLPPANSTLIADLRDEHIVSDVPEANIADAVYWASLHDLIKIAR
jgi:hypothetical protein